MKKKRCRYCKEYFDEWGMVKVPLGYFCSIEHAREHGQKKAKALKDKKERKCTRERKELVKTCTKWLAEAQTAVNAYIRIRDRERPCISCGGSVEEIENEQGWKVGGCWDAGHYRSRGAAKHLRFNLYNIHKQCKSCNGGSGKYSHKAESVGQFYTISLIEKIGRHRVESLNNDNSIRKFDIEYAKRIKAIFNKRSRHLKKLRGYE